MDFIQSTLTNAETLHHSPFASSVTVCLGSKGRAVTNERKEVVGKRTIKESGRSLGVHSLTLGPALCYFLIFLQKIGKQGIVPVLTELKICRRRLCMNLVALLISRS